MIRALAATALALSMLSNPALADDWEDCGNRENPAAMLDACTNVINNASYNRKDRGIAYLYRCQAKDMQGRVEEALEDCLASETLNAEDASLYNSLTIIYIKLKNPAEALKAAERGVDLKPNDGGYINGRANARCAYGMYEGSYEDRLRALELGRFSPDGLQKAMQGRGFYKGAIDGNFGSGSKDALRRWTYAGCP